MSYEGYSQNICDNNHLTHIDAYDNNDVCYCGAKIIWSNMVDDTNCDRYGDIPDELFKDFAYKIRAIPSKQEWKKIRTYIKNNKWYYCHNDKPLQFPTYEMCEPLNGCVGSGSAVIQPPMDNLCVCSPYVNKPVIKNNDAYNRLCVIAAILITASMAITIANILLSKHFNL